MILFMKKVEKPCKKFKKSQKIGLLMKRELSFIRLVDPFD
ncbi:hypothetical protein EV04_0963 [Prochlorococcus marinus str. LG]|nr:hypothetical protein EV04_0963 [Prochlorococcus marinus str. LG]